ncbi:glucose-methanol-choline oxidoreductase-like protein [Xylariomycetidae sp. FL0641]|nr:glucose-methanol-choline oxidoreductase-like protein [Xylariomycetidae sp. FL0641]
MLDEYGIIIVGGGTAGLVLANRLTEDGNVTVLVLEAGEDLMADPRVTTPALFPTLLGSDADWNTVTEPQPALGGKTISIPHGRALGGSSAINGQAFVATSKANVDAWEALGNPGWSWANLAPYFKRAHTLAVPPRDSAVYDHYHLDYSEPAVVGTEGPLQASFPDDTDNPLPKAWIETLQSLGHQATGDPFSGEIIGAYTNAATVDPDTRQRSYAASAYLKPVQSRENLTVITGAEVQKVLLSGAAPDAVATGVEYVHNGEVKTVRAGREVILSAGALLSPKLLELSGIGDPGLLASLDIPVVVANKNVGENLQDQPMTGVSFEVQDGVKTIDDLLRQDPAAMQAAKEQYATSRSGPLAVGGIFSYAFLPLQEPHADIPQDILESSGTSLSPEQAKYHTNLLKNRNESTAGFFTYAAQGNFGKGSGSGLMQSGFQEGNYYSVAVCLLQPLSRGSTHITSATAASPPRVDPGYLTHAADLEVFARHVAYIARIASTAPLCTLLKPGGRRNHAAADLDADLAAAREYVRATALSSWHPTSTCAMLPAGRGGVVDARLRVHGTRNLRVVDAAVFPITTRGNPMATVYAMAERAADLVREDLRKVRDVRG